jgi:hypothetical protein
MSYQEHTKNIQSAVAWQPLCISSDFGEGLPRSLRRGALFGFWGTTL